jgi:hypothetical protein
LLYWYAVVPFHHIVFRGMLLGIQRESMEIAASMPARDSRGTRGR